MTNLSQLVAKHEAESRRRRFVMLGEWEPEDCAPKFLSDITDLVPEYLEYVGWLCALPYSEYLKTEHWQERRIAALFRYDFKCWKCGATGGLQVHHLSYKFRGMESTEELMVLCEKCHKKEHGL